MQMQGGREGALKQFCGLAFVKVVVVVVAVSLVVINEADTGPQAKRERERAAYRARERGRTERDSADGHSSFALIRHPSLGWSSTMINCPGWLADWLPGWLPTPPPCGFVSHFMLSLDVSAEFLLIDETWVDSVHCET